MAERGLRTGLVVARFIPGGITFHLSRLRLAAPQIGAQLFGKPFFTICFLFLHIGALTKNAGVAQALT
ncbi:MAG: hypothetical protein R3E11_11820 [Sphingobium sp.]|jgi:hypothetical protein|nr:hypothetical protein [Sphingobium sp.]MCP5400575.1 hypothetical protein [Sphingomonas sp.]